MKEHISLKTRVLLAIFQSFPNMRGNPHVEIRPDTHDRMISIIINSTRHKPLFDENPELFENDFWEEYDESTLVNRREGEYVEGCQHKIDFLDIFEGELIPDLQRSWKFDLRFLIPHEFSLPETLLSKFKFLRNFTIISNGVVAIPKYFFKNASALRNLHLDFNSEYGILDELMLDDLQKFALHTSNPELLLHPVIRNALGLIHVSFHDPHNVEEAYSYYYPPPKGRWDENNPQWTRCDFTSLLKSAIQLPQVTRLSFKDWLPYYTPPFAILDIFPNVSTLDYMRHIKFRNEPSNDPDYLTPIDLAIRGNFKGILSLQGLSFGLSSSSVGYIVDHYGKKIIENPNIQFVLQIEDDEAYVKNTDDFGDRPIIRKKIPIKNQMRFSPFVLMEESGF